MTRFARAKGSKASNEKLPNEATPWHVMKQQLEDDKCKVTPEKAKSAKELLKNEEEACNINQKNDWAEFESGRPSSSSNTQKKQKHKDSKPNKIPKTVAPHSQTDDTDHVTPNDNKKTEDTEVETRDSKRNKHSNKKKQNINSSSSNEKAADTPASNEHESFSALTKRQKRNRKRQSDMGNSDAKRLKSHASSHESENSKKTREQKVKEKMEYKRKKPDSGGVMKIMINGVDVEIVKYDGFPIKKEDAERLTELKQKLIMKGIPKSDVDATMKLERRRAEKALARVKKVVCFHCRKSGHNLSDCPELGTEENNTGICFKCGSTEHTHFECKVHKGSTYGYAKCFICREQGHIAMQCPDNPKGMYPHGGCCKICGAVTHLKKDCPDLTKTKEESVITVEKMDDTAVESLKADKKEKDKSRATSKKIVKF